MEKGELCGDVSWQFDTLQWRRGTYHFVLMLYELVLRVKRLD